MQTIYTHNQIYIHTHLYLSLIKLAFAKQSKAELMRTAKMPGVLTAMGYWFISQYTSALGSLPSASMPGLMAFSNILANEIVTCNPSNLWSDTVCMLIEHLA